MGATQRFVDLDTQTSWQAQHFVNLEMQVCLAFAALCESKVPVRRRLCEFQFAGFRVKLNVCCMRPLMCVCNPWSHRDAFAFFYLFVLPQGDQASCC